MEGCLDLAVFHGQPEADILGAGRVLAEGDKLGHLSCLELTGEAFVLRPEQSDVRDGEQHHSQTLQTQSEGPAVLVSLLCIAHHLLVDDTTAQHLQPLAIEKNFQLKRRLSEGEVVLSPTHLHVAKQVHRQAAKDVLQVLFNDLIGKESVPNIKEIVHQHHRTFFLSSTDEAPANSFG